MPCAASSLVKGLTEHRFPALAIPAATVSAIARGHPRLFIASLPSDSRLLQRGFDGWPVSASRTHFSREVNDSLARHHESLPMNHELGRRAMLLSQMRER